MNLIPFFPSVKFRSKSLHPILLLPQAIGKLPFLAALTLGALTSATSGQTTYTWTGAAADGDWNNEVNWADIVLNDGVPVDDDTSTPTNGNADGLSLHADDKIVFSATTMPTTNIPTYGGIYDGQATPGTGTKSSPALVLSSGGAISFTHVGHDDSFWTNLNQTGTSREILTVGDGVSGVDEDVTLTISGTRRMNRHGNGIHHFRVNSDGTLIMNSNLNRWGHAAARPAVVLIDGGSVTFNDAIDSTNFNDGAIEFLSIGGTFTAEFGDAFANITAVSSALGTKFVNSSGGALVAVDNGGSFTVSAVIPEDPNYWTGTGGPTWDETPTVNFTTSLEAASLVEDTFANAKAIQDKVTFADEYFDAGVSQTVTQTTVSIATGGVSTDNVEFTNNAVSYDVSSAVDGIGITGGTNVAVSGGGMVTFSGSNTHTGITSVIGSSTLVLADSLALQNSTLTGNEGPVFDQSVGSNTYTLGGLGSSGALVLENNAGSPAAIELVVGNNDEDTTHVGEMSGAGSLTKIGTGTLTLDDPGANNSFTGDTLIKEGRIIAGPGNGDIGLSTASSVLLGDTSGSADATLQFDASSSTTFPASITYTVQTGSTGVARLHNSGNTQIQGDVILGSPSSDGKGVTLEAVGSNGGWDFRFQGVIQDPSGMTPGTAGDVTIGSNNNGEVRFEGVHTYSGDTVVESGGKLFVVSGGSLTFYPTSNGTNNQVRGGTAAGTGTVVLNSSITVDLTAADKTVGNMWPLVDATDLASVTYSGSFGVNSTSGAFSETAVDSGIWTLPDGLNQWTFDESTGMLGYSSDPDAKYWTGLGGMTWDAMTTPNFSNNIPSAAVDNVDFATATATTMEAKFADDYWDGGVLTPVVAGTNVISVGSGGVETGSIEFLNSATPYTISSSDTNGIKGATSLAIAGSGTVTLRGEHALSGGTTVNLGNTLNIGDGSVDGSIANSAVDTSGTLVFNNGGAVSQSGALSGSGTLEKLGAGVLTASAGSTVSGGTTVSAGILAIEGTIGSGSHTIVAGAILEAEYNGAGVFDLGGNTTISGDGTLRKTGTGETRWGGAAATFELSDIALIDVQEGVIRGGSNGNEVWTNNMSDLHVESGALFRGTEANVRVDVITGAGTIATGFNSAGYTEFTIGVFGDSGTFSGVIEDSDTGTHIGNLTKVGAGTQTLSGLNTYTGDTIVEAGAITVADGGQLTLIPGSSVIAGVASGTGTINLDGSLNLDLSSTTAGSSYLLMDATDLTVNYGATFGVTSSSGAFTESAGVWTADDGINEWTFTEATRILEVAFTIYGTWIDSYGYSGADALTTADPDSDSLSNLLEFGFGTNPSVSDAGPLSWDGVSATATAGSPMVSLSYPGVGVDISARFMRRKDHGTAGSVSYVWEFSSDLTDWESSAGFPSWLVAPADLADDASGDYDLVEVPYPLFLDSGKRARFFRVTVNQL